MLEKIMHKGDGYFPSVVGKKFKVRSKAWFSNSLDLNTEFSGYDQGMQWAYVEGPNLLQGIALGKFKSNDTNWLIFKWNPSQDVNSLNYWKSMRYPSHSGVPTNWRAMIFIIDASKVIWGGKALCRRILARLATAFRKAVVTC